jgi:hypothetical protein
MKLNCNQHGTAKDAYFVCMHVLRQEAPGRHWPPTEDEEGQVICAACYADFKNLSFEAFMMVCGDCALQFYRGERKCSEEAIERWVSWLRAGGTGRGN